MTVIVFNGEFTDLNSYIKIERTNRFMAANIKRNETWRVYIATAGIKSITGPVSISIDWFSKNRRKDSDNIAFATKFILDGIVKRGIISSDNQQIVKSINHRFFVDAVQPRVEVIIDQLLSL